VEQCLAKSPPHRFASATAFAAALDAASEPARDLPAPIRAWIARESQGVGLRVFLTIYQAPVLGMFVAFASEMPLLGMATSLGTALAFLALPTVLRTRRLLATGFGVDDIRIGLRDHWRRRQEELAYEMTGSAVASNRTLAALFGVSVISFIALDQMHVATALVALGLSVSGILGVGTGVLSLSRFLRGRMFRDTGTPQTRFWNSKWGERLARLAGFGLRRRATAQSLSQLTEVALGRATDALYDALPRAVRKQLKALPGAVRRLEADATGLRAELGKLDAALATLDHDAARAPLTSLAQTLRDDRMSAERDRLRVQIRSTRKRAEGRLAATVAALETIRLDLLRLQLGDGRVESVTASLDAANQVAEDLRYMVAASDEVNQVVAHARVVEEPTTR
jgi:hypothetical protein